MSRNALGKGLGALIGGGPSVANPVPRSEAGESVRRVSTETIIPSPLQPRKTFSEEQLSELADSIRENGIIQPLIVRQAGAKLELIAGERRWRAAQRAGLKEVPVIVRQAGDLEVLELALVENLQRSDLNAVEEAEGYARLAEKFNLTQEQIAQKVGKSRAAVANAVRLLGLAGEVKELLRHNHISTGHAKVLLGLNSAKSQEAAGREVVKRKLSVRETEKLVAQLGKSTAPGVKKKNNSGAHGSDWRALEQRLQRRLGTKVRLVGTASKGRLEIEYYNESDLERILDQFGAGGE